MRNYSLIALVAGTVFYGACVESEPSALPVWDAAFSDADSPGQKSDPDARGVGTRLVLLIGDGMGHGQLETASLYAAGRLEGLFMHTLPVRAEVETNSLSGTTDSAAAATALATGVLTLNGRVGVDAEGTSHENLVELAKRASLATGIVTTTRLSHATPAAFGAHVESRGLLDEIARQLALLAPDVMLGGGVVHFEQRSDGLNLTSELVSSDYFLARTNSDLVTWLSSGSREEGLLGLFADGEIPYVIDQTVTDNLPSLATMALASLARLDADPDGFFLMVEGGRIDHASHQNDIDRTIGETIAFDQTVREVVEWANNKPDVTIIVTADHETGGLRALASTEEGAIPPVSWRWGSHTDAHISLFAQGPGTEDLSGMVVDHRDVYQVLQQRIQDSIPIELDRSR